MKTALIDGDSIAYILAWVNRELEADIVEGNQIVEGAVDQLLIGIFQATDATHYMGAIGHADSKCFRYSIAKHKPYKGTRKTEQEDWVKRWKPVIMKHLRETWHFTSHPDLEADDLVCLAAETFKGGVDVPCPFVVCSPDKDLRQIPGVHYDYKKMDFADVSSVQADRNFWTQMLTGDDSDNIAGVPGLGPKKADEKLNKADQEQVFYEQVVRAEYFRYFDDYYGQVIYDATFNILSLVTTRHAWFTSDMLDAIKICEVPGKTASSIFGQ